MQGITPTDEKASKEVPEPYILKLPTEMFTDFKDIDDENEELFEYLCLSVIVNYLQKCCLNQNKWETALEFPDVIPS